MSTAEWSLEPGDVKPVKLLSDDLRDALSDMDEEIVGIDYDRVVSRACRGRGFMPCSVDCICISGKTTYYIEFKPLGTEDKLKEIIEQLPCKAMESLYFFDGFVKRNPTERKVLWVVSQDIHDGIAAALSTNARNVIVPECLTRYNGKKDAANNTLYYDEVRVLGVREFTKRAGNKLRGSTIDRISRNIKSLSADAADVSSTDDGASSEASVDTDGAA